MTFQGRGVLDTACVRDIGKEVLGDCSNDGQYREVGRGVSSSSSST